MPVLETPAVRIKRTMLSEPPRDESLLVAVISVMLLLFFSMICWREPEWFQLLEAIPRQVRVEGEYWRLFTAIAVHADLRHFLANALFFTFFTYLLYGYFGVWVHPFGMLILGAFTNYCSLLTYSPDTRLVGASGVVYLMAGFWLTLYVLIERTRSFSRRLLHAVGVGLVVLIPTNLSPEVSYRTHAIGCGTGVLAAVGYFQFRKRKIRSREVFEMEEVETVESPGDWLN